VALAIQHLASVAASTGDATLAARLTGFVDARYETLGLKRDNSEEFTYRRLRADLDDALPKDTLSQRMAEGAAMSEERAAAESTSA